MCASFRTIMLRQIALGAVTGSDTASSKPVRVSRLLRSERAFSILTMRSADLTAAARIRDAAIQQFGQHGFGVGLRAIAEAAGVSAALVIHHFGSKEGLRKACDDFVAEEIRSDKSEAMRSADPGTWFAAMAEIEEY